MQRFLTFIATHSLLPSAASAYLLCLSRQTTFRWLIQRLAERRETDIESKENLIMNPPDASTPVTPYPLSQDFTFPHASHPVQYPLNTTLPPPLTSVAGATLNPGLDLQKEQEMLLILSSANQSNPSNLLPPCVQVMVECAEYLATTALNARDMLLAEMKCDRTVFKVCCTSQGGFNSALFHSYCIRLRLIHNSICCGTLVALRAVLDQLRVWLQIGVSDKIPVQPHLPDKKLYTNKLGQLVTIMQQLEDYTSTVRFPDATILSQDRMLMEEIFAQHSASEPTRTDPLDFLDESLFTEDTQSNNGSNSMDISEWSAAKDSKAPETQ
jgi:hypothetical protein